MVELPPDKRELQPPDFHAATAEFSKFAVRQGYPANMLWVESVDIVAKKWKGQWTNFVWKGDPAKRKAIAGTEYQSAMAGNVGLAFEAICKADRWTICRVNIPADQDEAQRQMIPQKGVKHSVRCAPLPTVLVESSIRWRILKWLSRKAPTVLQ